MDGDALLDDELRVVREGFAARRPKLMADLTAAIEEIEALTIGRALDVGATAPDFRLYDVTHDRFVSLAGALEGGPAVVSFYRGEW